MADNVLNREYDHGRDDARDFYRKWSETYDSEVSSNGYATPKRCAKALSKFVSEFNTPVLDYACSPGLSGEALREEGFTTLNGYDISKEMQALADEKPIYSVLKCFNPDEGPEIATGILHAISAIGVINVGAVPPSSNDLMFDLLAPAGLFAFTFNGHVLANPTFEAKVKQYTVSPRAELLFMEYSNNLPAAGLKSNVDALKKA